MTSACPCSLAASHHPSPRREPDEPTGAATMSLAAFDSQQLDQFTRRFEDLFYAGDPASMASCYTEDAQLMADGIRPIQGHAAIRQFWGAAIARALAAGARRTIHLHESHSSGGLGNALCTVTIRLPPAGGSPAPSGTSRAAWGAPIWRRDPRGAWRVPIDSSPPLS